MTVRKRTLVVLAAAVLLACFGGGALAWRAQRGLAKAEALAKLGLWSGARVELERYLWWRPHDDRALLLMAEATIKDDLLAAPDAAALALNRLRAVRDDSFLAAPARLQEGRIELLLLHRPRRAEDGFRRALTLDADLLEAHYLLWKTLHLTGRYDQTEPQFWNAYERTREHKRAELLRQWYMSQFFPTTAIADLDRSLGLLGPQEAASADTELRRFFHFTQTEPDSPLGYAAAALWSSRSGEPQAGLQVLDEALPFLRQEPHDPFWLTARIHCLIDVGDIERAEAFLTRWPKTNKGFYYWRCRAMVLDESGQHEPALAAYDAALAIWPGPVDWRLRFRKANCLGRAGKQAQAEAERAAAKVIEDLNQEETHARLRGLMSCLDKPAALEEIADFYRKISRPKEGEQWLIEARRLSAPGAPDSAADPSMPHSGQTRPIAN